MKWEVRGKSIRVSFRDVLERHAFLRFPPEAKIKLAQKAGAPWNDQDPNAELSDDQKSYLSRRERIVCMEAGTGAGKSMMCGIEIACEFLLPYGKVGVLGDRYDHVGKEFRYAWLFITNLFRNRMSLILRCVCITQPERHAYHMVSIWGSWAIGCSLESSEGKAVLGETLTLGILCEGSQIGIRILNTKILRATDRALVRRSGFPFVRETGRLIGYTTPNQADGAVAELIEQREKMTRGKLERLRYGAVQWEDTFYAIRGVPSTMNPGFSGTVLAARKSTMSKQEYDEVYHGIAAPASGRVYKKFNAVRHTFRDFPSVDRLRAMRYGIGIDTGAIYAAILVGMEECGKFWVFGEYYGKADNSPNNASGTTQMILDHMSLLGYQTEAAACGRISLCVIDKTSQFKIDLSDLMPHLTIEDPFRENGEPFDLGPTIEDMDWLMENDRLFVSDECAELLEEFKKWVWKSSATPGRKGTIVIKEPIKGFDHGLDAMRYIILSMIAQGKEPFDEAFQGAETIEGKIAEEYDRILESAEMMRLH